MRLAVASAEQHPRLPALLAAAHDEGLVADAVETGAPAPAVELDLDLAAARLVQAPVGEAKPGRGALSRTLGILGERRCDRGEGHGA